MSDPRKLEHAGAPAPRQRDGTTIANLQVLRGLAATLVILLHVQRSATDISGYRYSAQIGAFGVDIFFVISGFIMFHTTACFRRSAGEFIANRLMRIVPLYWVATIALYGLYLVGFRPNGLHIAAPFDFLTSLAFIPRELPDDRAVLLKLGWTLIYELFFYFAFAATFVMRSHVKSFIALALTFIALGLAPSVTNSLGYSAKFFTNTIMLEFLYGAALALLYRRLPASCASEFTRALALAGGALLVLGFVAAAGQPIDHLPGGWHVNSRAFAAGLPALAVVGGALALDRAGHRWNSGPVMLLGAASYALYLFHPFVLQPAIGVFVRLVEARGLAAMVAVNAFTIGLSWALAIAIHLLLEKPLARWLPRFVAPVRQNSESAARPSSLSPASAGAEP